MNLSGLLVCAREPSGWVRPVICYFPLCMYVYLHVYIFPYIYYIWKIVAVRPCAYICRSHRATRSFLWSGGALVKICLK